MTAERASTNTTDSNNNTDEQRNLTGEALDESYANYLPTHPALEGMDDDDDDDDFTNYLLAESQDEDLDDSAEGYHYDHRDYVALPPISHWLTSPLALFNNRREKTPATTTHAAKTVATQAITTASATPKAASPDAATPLMPSHAIALSLRAHNELSYALNHLRQTLIEQGLLLFRYSAALSKGSIDKINQIQITLLQMAQAMMPLQSIPRAHYQTIENCVAQLTTQYAQISLDAKTPKRNSPHTQDKVCHLVNHWATEVKTAIEKVLSIIHDEHQRAYPCTDPLTTHQATAPAATATTQAPPASKKQPVAPKQQAQTAQASCAHKLQLYAQPQNPQAPLAAPAEPITPGTCTPNLKGSTKA